MGFFNDLLKGPAFKYATSIKDICNDLGISTDKDYSFSDEDLVNIINSQSKIPLSVRYAIVGCIKEFADELGFCNAKELSYNCYIYSCNLYGNKLSELDKERNKERVGSVFGY